MRLTHDICAITDPFCVAAMGAKYPDTGNTRTLSLQSKGFVALMNGVGGNAAVVFPMDPTSSIRYAASGNPSAFASWTAFAAYSGVSGLPSGFRYRIVSWGLTVKSTLSMMDNSGTLGVLSIPGGPSTVDITSIDTTSTAWASNVRIPMNDTRGLTAIGRSDGNISTLYTAPTGNVSPTSTTAVSAGNNVLVVYSIGNGKTGDEVVGEITYVINWELMFPLNSTYNLIATPAAVQNDALQEGSNFVKSATAEVFRGGVEEAKRMTHNAAMNFGARILRTAVNGIGGLVGGYLAGPSGAAIGSHAGMIMDVD